MAAARTGASRSASSTIRDGAAVKTSPVEVEGPLLILEERLDVHTENVEVARVRVRRRAHTRLVDVPSMELTREHVTVERVAIDRFVDCEPETRVEGDATVVPVVEEVLVRRLVLREELWIRKTCETVTTPAESIALRYEEPVIEREVLSTDDCTREGEEEASG